VALHGERAARLGIRPLDHLQQPPHLLVQLVDELAGVHEEGGPIVVLHVRRRDHPLSAKPWVSTNRCRLRPFTCLRTS
jgi:hypothetical protein